MSNKLDTYSELLDVHQKLHPDRTTIKERKRKPGRPRGQFPIRRYSIACPQDDIDDLDNLITILSKGFGKKVSRGALIGFLIRWLTVELSKHDPEDVHSFSDLAKLIHKERD
ncbi:MAG: hypothetical protein RBT34_06615 [Anaerolineaceae bacterium]|jgi:hypothetical protein|nr:hypothetical protein [Anaerolineaceae bacterium]MDY0280590.1 hypothetical protein [Salinivirgaceae bacterium]